VESDPPAVAAGAEHLAWLCHHYSTLLRYASASTPPLDWVPPASDLILVTRMTHVFSRAQRLDSQGGDIALAGIEALRSHFSDGDFGGWSSFPGADKRAYEHMFVLLAAATAAVSGSETVSGPARALLGEALDVIDEHFWSEELGVMRESFSPDWGRAEPYLGGNANMHAVEAYLAAFAATGDRALADRALRIAETMVYRQLLAGRRMLVEHFSPELEPIPDFNRDRPADGLRPFGSTVGHWMEWSRLLVELDLALAEPPAWLLESAVTLFDTAVELGWEADGGPGFVYTLDWSAEVSVDSRLHWVLAEAIAAASALFDRTGDNRYAQWYDRFWMLAARSFLSPDGSWRHELDSGLRPIRRVWGGRPDAYHASTALLARLAPRPVLASTQGES
jgi:sulfoquinovose isomerase